MSQGLYFPLFIDLSKKKIVVIGAGTIAKRRIRALYDFVGQITVVAPEIHPDIQKLANTDKLKTVRKLYESADIDDADIVLAATNDKIVNREIAELCKEKHIPVNNCSERKQCDFYFPGVIHTENVVIGVTASGQDHAKAKEIKEKIKEALDK
ncbi:MAG: bifunctional precorrin-2 dehydrogenase/sirohydrochlorin ferrochelatase [Clostridia bacterium]|nr:bifunctional precorrin-2 dehydrogenase/sirohydrochlorin ferrochelatase [Clostridia bacterium]